MKVMMTTGISLLMTLLSVQASFAKQISGYVRDGETGRTMSGVTVQLKGKSTHSQTDQQGYYSIEAKAGQVLVYYYSGFAPAERVVAKESQIDVDLFADTPSNAVVPMIGGETLLAEKGLTREEIAPKNASAVQGRFFTSVRSVRRMMPYTGAASESYRTIDDNDFKSVTRFPLSTFAADVDGASYSNVRRFLNQGELPPDDAVRVEEMINYFTYDLAGPTNGDPVRVYTELTSAPWNARHQLLRVSLKAKDIPTQALPASNFVFLIDVSGSMSSPNKLPLVKTSYKMLVDQLRDQDRVAIVTYANGVEVALESTPGSEKRKIKDAIDALSASGGTAGGAGLTKAYQIARAHFIKKGNNRIILATDGDFNVGPSSDEEMEKLIAKERDAGVSISILGYGMGNYKDSKLETLANKGRGNYGYVDNISEARKAIVTEFGGSLFTVAKDVKIQVEFNPHFVQSYRLVGYEHNLLEAEDFNNDTKLGGDMGVGHLVTALYELVPVGVASDFSGAIDDLKYQKKGEKPQTANTQNANNTELATVKFRYKEPDGESSKLVTHVVKPQVSPLAKVSDDFRFTTAVAEMAMLIRHSPYKQQADFTALIQRAKDARGKDEEGYRAEFVRLAQDAQALWKTVQ